MPIYHYRFDTYQNELPNNITKSIGDLKQATSYPIVRTIGNRILNIQLRLTKQEINSERM